MSHGVHDGDTLDDYQEVIIYGTNATLTDSDGDGLSDPDEILYLGSGFNATNANTFHGTINDFDWDFDGDNLTNGQEINYTRTDPTLPSPTTWKTLTWTA
ncbi:MAG: hypothetical protein ACXABD_03080 [Candidatus Thorarchaeota archaeon]